MSKLKTLNCPSCDAPIPGVGTCPYCQAEVRAEDAPVEEAPSAAPTWVAEARALMDAGKKIAAIKLVRERTGVGLKEAKELVEADLVGAHDLPTRPAPKKSDQGCFPASARVDTPQGPVSIADLRPGDAVWAFTPGEGRALSRVTRLLRHPPAALWVVASADGGRCTVTGNHRLLTSTGWCRVDRLQVGDRLIGADDLSAVRSVGPCGRQEPVFNVYTAGDHTVMIDGFVAHNFTTLPALRTLWHRLMVDPWVRAPTPGLRLA